MDDMHHLKSKTQIHARRGLSAPQGRDAPPIGLKRPSGPIYIQTTATSLPNLIDCFGVVLLHQAFVTATATNFAVAGESLCEPFGSNVAATSQTHRCH